MRLRQVLATTVMTLLSAASNIAAQTAPGRSSVAESSWVMPRTPTGDPDFQGFTWNFATMTPLVRPVGIDRAVMTEAEAAAYERQVSARLTANSNNGYDWWDRGFAKLEDRRSSLIVDPPNGQLPPLTAERQTPDASPGTIDDPENLPLLTRCLQFPNGAVPILPAAYNNNLQFIQTPDYIVIATENVHDARIIPMDGRPHGSVRRWMGDSRGRWADSTLEVDTTLFSPRYSFRGSDENLHIVERFTRVDRDRLDYEFTADDPTVWTRTWTARLTMHRTEDEMFEFACHEGNFDTLANMLHIARQSDQR